MKRWVLLFVLAGALLGGVVTEVVWGAPLSQTEGPDVPHSVEGREACLDCHTLGEGELAMPEDHGSRAEGSCLICHAAPAVAEEPTGATQPTAEPQLTAAPQPTAEAEPTQPAAEATPTLVPTPIPSDAYRGPEFCSQCHVPHVNEWEDSTHARAFVDPVFQTSWEENRTPGYCLACHATGYNPNTGSPMFEGVTCESCHGVYNEGHPQTDMMPVDAGAERCGVCHITTYQEWQLSGHSQRGVKCASCHAVHSQGLLFPTSTVLCGGCHGDRAEDFAHASHAEHNVTCADCHMYRPADGVQSEGQLPTGHFFAVESQACTQCHTRDSIHSRRAEFDPEADVDVHLMERISTLEGEVQSLEAGGTRNLLYGLGGGAVAGGVLGVILALIIRRRRSGGTHE